MNLLSCHSAPVRRHLKALSRRGVGYKQVAKASGTNPGILLEIRQGRRTRMRAQNARRVLAVTAAAARAPAARVAAGPTWRRLRWLLDEGGFTKTRLAQLLGSRGRTPSLQVGKERVLARTAERVKRLYEYYR